MDTHTKIRYVWRLHSRKFQSLDPTGAKLYGGRWNHPGVSMLYTSVYLSLAVLETLVHTDPGLYPEDLMAAQIQLPHEILISNEHLLEVSDNWKDQIDETRNTGSEWINRLKSLTVYVPSIVVPREFNLIINPQHPDFKKLKRTDYFPFRFDDRLLI